MKNLSECNEYEVFFLLADKIVNREITTFSALLNAAQSIITNQKIHPIILKLFQLIKQLNWGFCSEISLSGHTRLWRELVVPDKIFPDAGDLKKTISISNLYIVMLDIHGYTKFCQESRNNLSKLHTLDRIITNDARSIANQCRSICRRERGDEIIILSPSATDAITAGLCIIDYFSNTKLIHDRTIKIERSGDAASLPTFKVSGGIAGGKTPLIITEEGGLSGSLINTAARLQARANELSPRESKIMITQQVYINVVTETKNVPIPIIRDKIISFLNTGHIEFKGVLLPTCEILFKKEEMYKTQFEAELVQLYSSIRAANWEQKVFEDSMNLLIKIADTMPKFNITVSKPIEDLSDITNVSLRYMCERALVAYCREENYSTAIHLLKCCAYAISIIPEFDRLVSDYIHNIANKYEAQLELYMDTVNQQIDAKLTEIFDAQQQRMFFAAKKAIGVYNTMRASAQNSSVIAHRKSLWYAILKKNRESMSLTIYSGKK
ncbi:hypothetical protein PilKf_00314 [Pillotina sp. SPG140]|jgi:hypothetical protein